MANCSNCGAALPPDSPLCSYCHSRNDVDLKGIHPYTVQAPPSQRICPRCHKALQTLDLKIKGPFLIERCADCYGLFFDPNELEALLDASLAHADTIDWSRLQNLQQLKNRDDYAVTYISCPVCSKLMNRINWGTRSGVIVDRCRAHGIWLDGGELRRILAWAKAGGAIHHERVQVELERQELRQERERLRQIPIAGVPSDYETTNAASTGERIEGRLLRLILRFLDLFI